MSAMKHRNLWHPVKHHNAAPRMLEIDNNTSWVRVNMIKIHGEHFLRAASTSKVHRRRAAGAAGKR